MTQDRQLAGIEAFCEIILDPSGLITALTVLNAHDFKELNAEQEGRYLRDILPNIPEHVTNSTHGKHDEKPATIFLNVDDQLVVVTASAGSIPDTRRLLFYKDSIGLSELYEKNQRLEVISRSLYESSLDAIITIDGNSLICEFGQSAEKLFGYQRHEVLGKNVADIIIPPALRQAHHDGMRKFNETLTGPVLNTRVEVQAMRRDESIFPCELTVVPTQAIDGKTYFTATIRDITERRAHEASLKKAREIAEANNMAKTRFLAHMSHEIRSPMNAVLGCMDLLLDSSINPEQQSLVETSMSAGAGLLGIIDDILDFSKIEAGEFKANFSAIKLADLCEQVADVITVRAGNKNIDIAVVLDPNLPSAVQSDISFLRRILTNLLDNAVKFTHDGGVCLSVLVGEISATENHADIIFEVSDTGIGIAEDKQHQLFQEFSQVDSSDTTDYGGTGLGLAICKKLIEQLGGYIHLTSQPGQGSLFRIVMPFKTEALPASSSPKLDCSIAVASSNPSFKNAITKQAALWQHDCQCVSDISDFGEAGIYIIDVSQTSAAPSVIARKCAEKGIAPDKVIIYAPAFSTDSVLGASSAGFSNVLHRPLKPSTLAAGRIKNMSPNSAPAQGEPLPATTSPEKRHKLLLAEDNQANQLVAKTMLERAGYQLDIVDNGLLAVEAAEIGNYSLILMDLRMPELDGIEACKRIRALDSDTANIPIIAMTANAFASDIARCLDAGMNDFIAKPVDRQGLLLSLDKWLNSGSQSPDPRAPDNSSIQAGEVLDASVIQQLVDDTSPDAVATIMTMIIEEIDKLSNHLSSLDYSNATIAQLREAAHSSKSSAGYCGATQLQSFCQQLETACDLLDQDQLKALHHKSNAYIEETRAAISIYLSTLSPD
ncbi:ATP-binding protein [Spongiibacter marinus]|uniref:ATP-binding protein n=1 Tax=Spongiibacter marinus TaxID=354246 RepID=UPI0035654B6C